MVSAHGQDVLRAVEVSFAYAQRRPDAPLVVDRVSLSLQRGSIVGLLGPNGSGKTTLLRLLAGMVAPTAGRVELNGAPVHGLSRRALARQIAVVPQDTHTTFDFSVLDMVLMGRYPHLGTFELEGAADIQLARDALEATGTRGLEARAFSTLSGGERQRVVIAAALVQASDTLLLDEPTASLDLGYQLEIAALLERINATRGTTILVSTHDLNLAASVCGRVIMLKQGRIVAQGPTAETLTAGNLRQLFGVETDVRHHEGAGHLTVVPLSRAR
jgi:iron complex transport system ATP-binding protein